MKTIQIPVDDNIMREADGLFASLGLDTVTAVRIFLNAAIENGGIPFPVAHRSFQETPNEETIAALQEGTEMIRNPEKYKRYATFREAMNEVLRDA